MDALIEEQKKTHSHLKRFLTTFENKPAAEKTLGFVQSLLAEVELLFRNFKQGHDDICSSARSSSILDDDVPYLKDEVFYEVYDLFITFKSKLLDSQMALAPPSPTMPGNHASTFVTTTRNDTTSATARLPKIDLPTFTGDYLEWIPFRDMFLSLVHNNTTLTQVQKYFYLKGSCTGTPKEMVEEYPATNDSYEPAWSALVNRYHNKRKLVDQILRKLFNAQNTDGRLTSIRQLLDLSRNCLALLRTLEVNTSGWDPILMFLLTQKIDKQTRKEWEQTLHGSTDIPSVSSFLQFLDSTYKALEFVEEDSTILNQPKLPTLSKNEFRRKPQQNAAHTATTTSDNICPCCNRNHLLYKCFKFATLSASEKKDFVKQKNLCINCFGKGHTYSNCTSTSRCKVCNESHHTLLHHDCNLRNTIANKNNSATLSPNSFSGDIRAANAPASNLHSLFTNVSKLVLLATVRIIVETPGRKFYFKALVDQGAQTSFISEDAVQLLRLKTRNINANISGIGGTQSFVATKAITLNLRSHYNCSFDLECDFILLPKVTTYTPATLEGSYFEDLPRVFLADPDFNSPAKIDFILGADLYCDILLTGMIKSKNGLILQETHFGWMVSGPIKATNHECSLSVNLISIDDQLRLFWEQEELTASRTLSTEETEVEKHFLETHTRDYNGRYTVHLPFQKLLVQGELPTFSHTSFNALRRLNQLEKRFNSQPDFAMLYKSFMEEYESLGHMKEIGEYPKDIPLSSYFLCHHGVLRESSSTTKLRVVFDGGNCHPEQSSLNSELAAGPALQNDLPLILTRWRYHKIAFTADLEKMFRQINVCDDHQKFQCILWRDDKTKPIKIYKLCTVTYGTTSAPYLAIRVLHQLATDEQSSFPLASKILLTDSYVDDILSGGDSVEEVIEINKQLTSLCKRGGFNLRKWNSNSPQLLEVIPAEYRDKVDSFRLTSDNLVKALGLYWETKDDQFCFKVDFNFATTITKSSLLSDAAKLFDPLGWLAPSTIIAKIIFQKLWLEGLDWQDPLPPKLHLEWIQYRDTLKELENIKIPRWLGTKRSTKVDLHGFCDSSQAAYGAVVYAVVYTDSGVSSTLVQSKTRVAPLKVLSIPRLELCAATLLVKLMAKVKTYFEGSIGSEYYWTDSTTVLSWIRSHSSRWAVYVANRVAEIQRLSSTNQWKHVPTSENPADCLTRGLTPSRLNVHTLWWSGPSWLIANPSHWPKLNLTFKTDLEQRKSTVNLHNSIVISKDSEYFYLVTRYSSLSKLLRVTAYILRFYNILKSSVSERLNGGRSSHETGFLKSCELNYVLTTIVKVVQRVDFSSEINCLRNKTALNKNNRILQLDPFLDENNLLRVGGRISKANTTFEIKHPLLLHKDNPLSLLIFTDAHHQTLHGGVQLMMAYVMRRFWILSSRALARSVLRKCLVCAKYIAKMQEQKMGNLPAVRLQPARPFKHSGLDYAGPINIKLSTLRKSSAVKAYICLFVCMCTKAIHLEAVSSLTTEAFIAAFRRFISRRGRCTDLYSDCGTTFIGADKELKLCFERHKLELPEHLAAGLAHDGTTWHFIPPGSPHFGGLWEAGVKSAKHHLRRIMRDRILTFEELTTLLTQIESCLNSRPICPLGSHPYDSQTLTPAHFLVGEPTTCISEESYLDNDINTLSRWKLVERLKQHFWQRWSSEYIHTLQTRSKWSQSHRNLAVGDVVLLKHEHSAPGYWPLARIHQVHAGTDGLVRVVTLYCNGKLIKRPVSKVCLLPTMEQQSDCTQDNNNVIED